MEKSIVFPLLTLILIISTPSFTLGTTPLDSGASYSDENSPYSKNENIDLPFILGGTATVIYTHWLTRNNHDELSSDQINRLDRSKINWLDRTATNNWSPSCATASDVLLYTFNALPLALAYDAGVRNDIEHYGVLYLETALAITTINSLFKGTIARNRPYAYNDDPRISLEQKQKMITRRSFFSGHTSNAFASAVFTSMTYDAYDINDANVPYVWGVTLAGAATVGFLRYHSGWHFPTDILTGAIVGSAVSFLVLKLHERDNLEYTGFSGKTNPTFSYTITIPLNN